MVIIAQAEVEKFMKDSGVSCDKKELQQFFDILGDRKVTDLVAEGAKKKCTMPSGGGRAAASSAAAGPVAEEAPKEEKKEEAEDVNMGGLFGDDDDDYWEDLEHNIRNLFAKSVLKSPRRAWVSEQLLPKTNLTRATQTLINRSWDACHDKVLFLTGEAFIVCYFFLLINIDDLFHT